MFVSRIGNRFIASFDVANLLGKVIENTENTKLVFESVDETTANSEMLVEGDVKKVEESVASMGIPCLTMKGVI